MSDKRDSFTGCVILPLEIQRDPATHEIKILQDQKIIKITPTMLPLVVESLQEALKLIKG